MKTYFSYRYAGMSGIACRKQSRKSYSIREFEYFGQLCVKCQTNLRYAEDRKCVLCSEVSAVKGADGLIRKDYCSDLAVNKGEFPVNTMFVDRKIRKAAALVGMTIYKGCKCDACGGEYRYVKRGQCVECVSGRNAAYRAYIDLRSERAAVRKKKAAPVKTETADFDHLF